MSSKIGLKLARKYSFNFSLPKRSNKKIKFIEDSFHRPSEHQPGGLCLRTYRET